MKLLACLLGLAALCVAAGGIPVPAADTTSEPALNQEAVQDTEPETASNTDQSSDSNDSNNAETESTSSDEQVPVVKRHEMDKRNDLQTKEKPVEKSESSMAAQIQSAQAYVPLRFELHVYLPYFAIAAYF